MAQVNICSEVMTPCGPLFSVIQFSLRRRCLAERNSSLTRNGLLTIESSIGVIGRSEKSANDDSSLAIFSAFSLSDDLRFSPKNVRFCRKADNGYIKNV